MANDSSGGGWASALGVGIGAVYVMHLYRRLRARAVDPDGQDPSRILSLLVVWGCPALAVGVLVANIAAFNVVGSEALLPALVLDLVAVVAIVALAIWLWDLADSRRRRTGYVICEASYGDAPRQIKATMRRIYKSARTVRGGTAYQQGMFGAVELDRLVYSAAERAVLSSELCAGMRDLKADARREDHELLETAQQQLADIRVYIEDVEGALTRSADTANRLSASIPAKEVAAQQAAREAAAAAADRRRHARARVEEASTRASAPTKVAGGDVEDRVSSVYAGYQEASKISNDVLTGPTSSVPNSDADERPSTRETAWKAAKWTAGKTTKASVAAAKFGADKLKKRSTED
jgi:hypothetical protein